MTPDAPVPSPVVLSLPVLPLRNGVLLPSMFMPATVGKANSIVAVEAALATEEKALLVVAQRHHEVESPTVEDLYTVGTRAVIRKMTRSENAVEVLLQGTDRMALLHLDQAEPYLRAQAQNLPVPEDGGTEVEALHRAVLEQAGRIMQLMQPQAEVNLQQLAAQAGDPLRLAYLFGSMLGLDVEREQALLESPTRAEALRLMHGYLGHELQVLELRQQISSRAQSEMTREQREYTLRRQMEAIQEELGDKNPEKAELDTLKRQVAEADLPDDVRKEIDRELARLTRMPSAAPDYQLTRSYLELALELPWRKSTVDAIDLTDARRVLDEDHFDLSEVKDRILEHLAVLKLNPNARAPILCFVGPPGVGKTSLGLSIARAMGRNFERASLGGMHDEAELRGHRRTYIGAMPGRIIQAIRRAKVNNPVLMLDEIDKLGRDFRGDPASALLEVLDPAQNGTFRDNYLDLPFDLSRVFFVTTANTLDTIPRPLLDRMEILRLAGYSDEEKVEIARRYLIPRQLRESGLTAEQLTITSEALAGVIAGYTREAGLRQLERVLGRLARKTAVRFAKGETAAVSIQPEDLPELLGPRHYLPERARPDLPAGVVTGLAWTEAGGEVLHIEASLLPGARRLRLTGQLGEVMRESATAAQSYVWAHARQWGIGGKRLRESGVHVHVPAGAVPKDGPSAGVAMVTALASAYTDIPARADTAMTGEITLSGLVLPIGGVKEKVLAARRAGIRRVILPRDNEKDVRDVPESARNDMEFVFAERIEEVLDAALPGLAERGHRGQRLRVATDGDGD